MLECQAQTDLDYYIGKAKANSPLIIDNNNLSKVMQFEADRLRAFYTKPQIGITAGYIFAPIINLDNGKARFEGNAANADKYYGYDIASTNNGQYMAMLNISQPLFNGKKLKVATNQVNISSEISLNSAKISGHDIEKVVTDQYILCLQDFKQIDYVKAMLYLISEQKGIVTILVESSIYKRSDLTLLDIERRNFLLQISTLSSTYRRDLMDLNILCGINDTAIKVLKPTDLSVSLDASNSLFLKKYKLDSMNILAMKDNFELKYRPQLFAFANTGLNAVYAPTIPNRFGMNAGLSFTYNFYDGGQKEINRNKADVLLKSVSAYEENFKLQNNIRKNKALSEISSMNERIAISEQQLIDYENLLGLYKNEILTGQLSIVIYLSTLKSIATFQRDNTLLLSQKQLLINTYNYWNW